MERVTSLTSDGATTVFMMASSYRAESLSREGKPSPEAVPAAYDRCDKDQNKTQVTDSATCSLRARTTDRSGTDGSWSENREKGSHLRQVYTLTGWGPNKSLSH
jgi:hypothetical protein